MTLNIPAEKEEKDLKSVVNQTTYILFKKTYTHAHKRTHVNFYEAFT